MAGAGLGRLSNGLRVGNVGDGHINAVDPATGDFLGQLRDANNTPITIDGLWGLDFGNDANAGPKTTLFFTAGIKGDAGGLVGAPVGGSPVWFRTAPFEARKAYPRPPCPA